MSTDQEETPYFKRMNGVIVPGYLLEDIFKQCYEMVPDAGDVVLVTYPKCGCNWGGQILSLFKSKGVPPSTGEDFLTWCPFLDFSGTDVLRNMSRPRIYKQHFNYEQSQISKEAKYVYIARNPKDALVSLYHYVKTDAYKFKNGKFDVIFDLFVKGEVLYNDFFDHVLSWYARKDDPNVLFLYYEDMRADLEKAVERIGNFVGGEFADCVQKPEILRNIVEFSSFEYMKSTTNELFRLALTQAHEEGAAEGSSDYDEALKSFNTTLATEPDDESMIFVRKGVVGDWKNVLSSEQNEILNAIIERKLKGSDMYNYWKSIDCL